jgi:hypothetical protein
MIRKWGAVCCKAWIRYEFQCCPVEVSLSSRNIWGEFVLPSLGVEFLGAKQGIV